MSFETKEIICFYLFLFISVIIPIDIDGCFRTIKIIQDNIRPFIVVFITLSITIYLKIYDILNQKYRDDTTKFTNDFLSSYNEMQKNIHIYENDHNDCRLHLIQIGKHKYIENNLSNITERLIYLKPSLFDIKYTIQLFKTQEMNNICYIDNCLQNVISKYIKNPHRSGKLLFDYNYFTFFHFSNILYIDLSVLDSVFFISYFQDANLTFYCNINTLFLHCFFTNSKIQLHLDINDDESLKDFVLFVACELYNSEIELSVKLNDKYNDKIDDKLIKSFDKSGIRTVIDSIEKGKYVEYNGKVTASIFDKNGRFKKTINIVDALKKKYQDDDKKINNKV